MHRLLLVIRRDLSPGDQLAQVAHAALDFAYTETDVFRRWHDGSNTLLVFFAQDEAALKEIVRGALDRDFAYVAFEEPDMGGAMTAVCLEPSAKCLVRGLELAYAPPRTS